MIRTLAIVGTLLLTGGALAEEKKPRFLTMERGSSIITSPHDSKSVYTGSPHGGSLIVTDPRTMKTVAILPREKR
jgi:hypothetical protein